MSTSRKLGVFFTLAGFLAVCVLALTLRTEEYGFSGLPGIETELANQAGAILAPDASGAVIEADGRNLSVQLPDIVQPTFDRARLTERLESIDGVRSVELVGDVVPDIAPPPGPTPSEAPTGPTPDTTPDVAPPAEPTAEATPEPTPEPEPEPTPEPTPEPAPEPAPSLSEVVEGLDLSDVNFEPGTARFTAQDTAVLDAVADELQGLSGGPVQVQSHTDNVGDPDVNLLLSQDRADAVVTYLIDRGVDASLLTSRGFGAQEPIADNSTEQGRDDNERVVFVVEGN